VGHVTGIRTQIFPEKKRTSRDPIRPPSETGTQTCCKPRPAVIQKLGWKNAQRNERDFCDDVTKLKDFFAGVNH
jgi:hypothetical protein